MLCNTYKQVLKALDMLKINFVLEKDVALYEDDPSILQRIPNYSGTLVNIKINDETYRFCCNGSLEDAKDYIGSVVCFSKFSVKSEEKGFICNYCGGSAVGEAKISLLEITIYKRPPKGAKDLKIQLKCGGNYWYKSPYVYRVRNTSAYCEKCGSTE